jgi:hypothetical protein
MHRATSIARVTVAIAALSQVLVLALIAAQAPPAAIHPRFEVASVKRNLQTPDEYMANPTGNVSAAFRILTLPGGADRSVRDAPRPDPSRLRHQGVPA